jgi:hypothetical protein
VIDTTTPLSPGWYLQKMMDRLAGRQAELDRLERYYRGEPDLPWVPPEMRKSTQAFMRKARANWATLIVEATRERMVPVGFRTGAEDDELGDAEAWRIWQTNNLDADAQLVHRAKMAMRDAYVIVGSLDPATGYPVITPEDPRQVVTLHDPVNRRRVTAALKVFTDDLADVDLAYLYLPGLVYRAMRRSGQATSAMRFDPSGWEWLDEGQPQRLPHDRVPVVRFPNRADLSGASMGEFEDVIDDIDRINLMLLQRLVVAVAQAFRQRALKGGAEMPATDPESGEPVNYAEMFRADPAAFWFLPEGVEVWESAGVDLTPLLESVKADVRDLAATTRTPMFYLFPDAANGSAEGASLQREGLVFKVSDRIIEASDPWEQVMSLAFLTMGDEGRAQRTDMEVLWAPPERFTLSERYDAASKASAAGVPWSTVMKDVLQFSPQQVQRMEAERATDLLFAADDLEV